MDYDSGINWDSMAANEALKEATADYAARMKLRATRDLLSDSYQWNAYRKKAIYGQDYITSGGKTLKKLQGKPNTTKRA